MRKLGSRCLLSSAPQPLEPPSHAHRAPIAARIAVTGDAGPAGPCVPAERGLRRDPRSGRSPVPPTPPQRSTHTPRTHAAVAGLLGIENCRSMAGFTDMSIGAGTLLCWGCVAAVRVAAFGAEAKWGICRGLGSLLSPTLAQSIQSITTPDHAAMRCHGSQALLLRNQHKRESCICAKSVFFTFDQKRRGRTNNSDK